MNPDPTLQGILSSATATQAFNAQYLAGSSGTRGRQWLQPPGFSTTVFDATSITQAFSRAQVNSDATAALQLSTGERDGKALELAYLSMLERSFRIRNHSCARCQTHAAGRLSAHGITSGVFGKIIQYVQNMETGS